MLARVQRQNILCLLLFAAPSSCDKSLSSIISTASGSQKYCCCLGKGCGVVAKHLLLSMYSALNYIYGYAKNQTNT